MEVTAEHAARKLPPLRADRVSFRYVDEWVLREASIHVEPGQVVGLWGPSGCGKSTLGRLLSGRLRPDSGTISAPPPSGQAHSVQLVAQHAEQAVNPRWKISAILAEAGSDLAAVVESGLVSVDWLEAFPHEVSGGELQRICLARAILARPDFLVADEITASLDALTQAQIWRIILSDVARGDYGVLAISHDMPLLNVIADQILSMDEVMPAGPRQGERGASSIR